MENSRVNVVAVLMVAVALCVVHVVPGLSQPAVAVVDDNRKMYVGAMVGIPFAQDLHHQISARVPNLNMEVPISGDLSIGYGLGFAAVVGRGISDYVALELTGSWSNQPSDLRVSLPAILTQGLSTDDLELPSSFSYDGNGVALQSKIDLLIYPMKMATGSDRGANYPIKMATGSDRSAKPYLGGGVGIVRSNMDLDIKEDAPTQAFIKALEAAGFAELLSKKIDDTGTDFQLSLRAGVNVPFRGMDLDLGWQFYRTYVEGKDNNSHVAGCIVKYAF